MRLCTTVGFLTELCVCLQCGYVELADFELNCVSCCGEVTYCWRILNWTVCLVEVRLCTAGGFWTELCIWFQWGYILLSDLNWTVRRVAVLLYMSGGSGLYCVSGFSEFMYSWPVWNELCVWLQWDYVFLAGSELNCVSGCIEVIYN